jgi:hypothetical protein
MAAKRMMGKGITFEPNQMMVAISAPVSHPVSGQNSTTEV